MTNFNGLFQVSPTDDSEEKLGTDVLNGESFRLQTVDVSYKIIKVTVAHADHFDLSVFLIRTCVLCREIG